MGESIHIEPCPWCGMREADQDAECQKYVTIEPRSIEGALRVNMDGFGWYWVACSECAANGPKYHGETYSTGNTGPKNYRRDPDKTAKAIKTAVDAWNKRAEPTLFDVQPPRLRGEGDGE